MASGRAVPSDLLPLVLGFLRENHFDKAARAFGKAAGVTEQDPNADSLLDIFNYWLKSPIAKKQRTLTNESPAKKTKKESLSRYKNSSENKIPPVKKQAAKPVTKLPVSVKATQGNSESSSTDSSDSTDSEQEKKTQAKKGIVLQSAVQKTKPQKTSKSSDSSSSEDETPKQQVPKSERAPKVTKLASTTAKPTKAMSKTTNGKAESSSSSSSDETSSEDSSSEENQPVKGKLKKLPQRKNNTAQPLPVKNKPVKKKSSSESSSSDDDSEHEKLAPKPKRGEYSAVPPPLAIEATKGKAHLTKKTSKKKGENSKKKEQAKKPSTKGSVIKKASAPKSLPAYIQKGHNSSESDSDSSSEEEEEKKVLVKCSAKAIAANGAAKSVPSKKSSSSSDSSDSSSEEEEKKVLVKCSAKAISANSAAKSVPSKKASSSSDSSDSDSSDSVPEKRAVKTGIKKVKKPPAVPAKKVESIVEDKTVHKRKGTKAVKTAPKSSIPVSKPKSSESSSSSSEEETQPTQKAASKLSGGGNLVISKQAPAESKTSSESSTDEQFKISEQRERKREQNNCKAAKKALKPSANLVGKTSASKTSTSEVLNTANNGNSDEEATKEAGLSKKKRKRKNEQELETLDIKKMKARGPHTFPKSKQQSSPFRRIRTEEIEIDMRVANNSFDAKKGAMGDWGEKANDVLRFTKGKSFRHEKTKKKRGSYCGGTISTQINSIKFESD